MDRDLGAKEMAGLKEALASVEHQLDACEARAAYQPKAPQVNCLARSSSAADRCSIAFANKIVAAMKNRLTEDRIMVGMPPGTFS